MGMFILNPLWVTLFLNWVYTPPVAPPALSAAQEAHFQRIFQWDATRPGEVPAVIQAIKAGDLQRLKYLQTQGAYIPPQLAMQWANAYGHLPIVQWLRTQEAQLIPTDYGLALDSGNTALITWWQQQPLYTQILQYQQKEPNEEWQPVTEDDNLSDALMKGDFDKVQALMAMGYPRERLRHKPHLLIEAAHGGSLEAVQWLLQQGVALQPETPHYIYKRSTQHLAGLAISVALMGSGEGYGPFLELQPTALEEAMAQKHIALAIWLAAQGATPQRHLIKRVPPQGTFTPQIRDHIRAYRSLEVAHQLQHIPYKKLNDQITQDMNEKPSLLLTAIQAEHLPLVQYLLLRYPHLLEHSDAPNWYTEQNRETWHQEILSTAIFTHSIPLVRFLVNQGVKASFQERWPLQVAIEWQDQALYNLIRDVEDQSLLHKKAPATTR